MYIPPDGQNEFEIDAIIGSETSIDERDVGGDMITRSVSITVETVDLARREIHKVQAWARVRIGGQEYNVSLTESQYGRFFTTIRCVLKQRLRQPQYRD